MPLTDTHFPYLGFGLGLRIPHYAHIFEHRPQVDWFEIISENFMDTEGKARRNLARIRDNYPVVMHGVSLSIGSVDVLNSDYLRQLRQLVRDIEPAWISDHLCWTGVAHRNLHDLLPLPYTEEALNHVVDRVQQVQDYLGRPIALENPSTYLAFATSQIPEAEFLAELAKRSGCQLLLDVNNVYVSCFNHRQDIQRYLDALPLDKVVQIHLSGHSHCGTHIIDTHDDHVVDPVWRIYEYVLSRAARPLNAMIEWDDHIPPWDVLYAELGKAKAIAAKVCRASTLPPLPTIEQQQAATPEVCEHTMTSLQDAQWRMQESILQGHQTASKSIPWALPQPGFGAAEQLGVYINAYRARLRDVTASDFPVLQHYVGDERFDTLLNRFVEETQSGHFNIGRYTAALPAWLAKALPQDRFAQELATLEAALCQLQDAPESIPLTQQHLLGLTAEALDAMVLQPRHASRLWAFAYPVEAWYTAVQEGKAPAPPQPHASYLLVYRHDDVVWRMNLEADEFALLQQLLAGTPVNAAMATLQQKVVGDDTTLEASLAQWFSRWMRNGVFRHSPESVLQWQAS